MFGKTLLRFLCKLWFIIPTVYLASSFVVTSQNSSEDTRGFKPREYAERLQNKIAKARPPAKAKKKKAVIQYAAGKDNDAPVAEGIDVGVTFWRLRPARKTDAKALQEPTRIVIRKKGQSEEKLVMMVPARMEAEALVADGDLLKLTIESPFETYVYIINREQYSDGSYSAAYLIFPAKSDVGRNDKGFPGRLLFLPSENDDDKFEVTRLNADGKEKTTEVFTVILSKQPLKDLPPLEKSDEPRPLDKSQFERWQNDWGGQVWKFERQNSAGLGITKAEKNAGAKGKAPLSEDDPPPQTVYHVSRKSPEVVLFTVPIKIGK